MSEGKSVSAPSTRLAHSKGNNKKKGLMNNLTRSFTGAIGSIKGKHDTENISRLLTSSLSPSEVDEDVDPEGTSDLPSKQPDGEKKAEQADKEETAPKGPSWKLCERSRQTRRLRNSLYKCFVSQEEWDKIQFERRKSKEIIQKAAMQNLVMQKIVRSFGKSHLCDTRILGCDGSVVMAPSYLLALHSSVIEDIIYPPSTRGRPPSSSREKTSLMMSIGEDPCEAEGENSADVDALPYYDIIGGPVKHQIDMPFATGTAISTFLHFLAALSLPTNVDDVRIMCQVYFIGKLLQINPLADEAYGRGRILINQSSTEMTCAAFDECKAFEKMGSEIHNWWGYSFKGINEMKSYTLECILDAPAKLLLRGGGVKYLNPDSLREILGHKDLDSDELTVFYILKRWMEDFDGDYDRKLTAAKILAKNINFSLIPPEELRGNVSDCDFVEKSVVEAALHAIEVRNSTQSSKDLEHVIVEGSGQDHVNGMYVRLDEDIGMDADDIVFVKEASHESGDNLDFGLFLHRDTWNIASSVDYSNILYSCKIKGIALHPEVPELGWVVNGGTEPAPSCNWNAAKKAIKSRPKNNDAPNIEDLFDQEKKLCDQSIGKLQLENGKYLASLFSHRSDAHSTSLYYILLR